MTNRFCPQCQTEVEDTGGFCLLGHSLRLAAPVDSLKNLRAEVDRAFEQVSVDVADVLDQVRVSAGSQATALPPPPPPPRRSDPFVELEAPTSDSDADPMADFAPAPRMDWGPERHGLLKRFG